MFLIDRSINLSKVPGQGHNYIITNLKAFVVIVVLLMMHLRSIFIIFMYLCTVHSLLITNFFFKFRIANNL